MKKSTPKRNARPCAKEARKENPDANPRRDTAMETGVGDRKRGSGRCGDYETQARRYFRTGLRTKIGEPTAATHQSFTMALKPAPTSPFLATSAAFGSA